MGNVKPTGRVFLKKREIFTIKVFDPMHDVAFNDCFNLCFLDFFLDYLCSTVFVWRSIDLFSYTGDKNP